jgi:hypothetical protein
MAGRSAVEAKVALEVRTKSLKVDLRQSAATRCADVLDIEPEAGKEGVSGEFVGAVEHGETSRCADALGLR